MMTEHDTPARASHIQDFKFLTASGYTITGSVQIVLKTQVQPVPPPRSSATCNPGDHWQVVRINEEDLMVLNYEVNQS